MAAGVHDGRRCFPVNGAPETVDGVLRSGHWLPFVHMEAGTVERLFGLKHARARGTARAAPEGVRVYGVYTDREEVFVDGAETETEAWCMADREFLEHAVREGRCGEVLGAYREACRRVGRAGFTAAEAARWFEEVRVQLVVHELGPHREHQEIPEAVAECVEEWRRQFVHGEGRKPTRQEERTAAEEYSGDLHDEAWRDPDVVVVASCWRRLERWGRSGQELVRSVLDTLHGEGHEVVYTTPRRDEVECVEKEDVYGHPVLEVRVCG